MVEKDLIDNCIKETTQHQDIVKYFVYKVITELKRRAQEHDDSKMKAPELELFAEMTPKLKELTYGSDEYKQALEQLGPALEHHYQVNRHHPEHFENGIDGMTLMDLIEMLCDWKAATLRHEDGNIEKSLRINKERFGISEQLAQILSNTIRVLDKN